MGVKMRFRSLLFDGSEVHSQFIDSYMTDVIGRKRLAPLYDTLALHVTKGEKGTMVATSKYAYGDAGKFPLIPPYATFRVDYEIVDLRKKEFWELG